MGPKTVAEINLEEVLEGRQASFPAALNTEPKPLPSVQCNPSPKAWEDQVLYFLLPDRFSDDSDGELLPMSQRGNAVRDDAASMAWRDAGSTWVGGTLKGIQKRLHYLKGLGVTALWIGPIFKQAPWAGTYHGYGVQGFLEVDPNFGTAEELQELVKAAHDRGIYVILDIILNHSADVFAYKLGKQPWTGQTYEVEGFRSKDGKQSNLPFQPLASDDLAKSDPDVALWPAELHDPATFTKKGYIKNWDWYPEYLEGDFDDFKDIDLGVDDPYNFSPTTGLTTLCKCYKYWIAFADIDGFRIDTVKHMGIGPSRYFASNIHEFTYSIGKENFLLMGEVTGGRIRAWDTVERTGIDAALGIDDVQDQLEYMPKGFRNPEAYFQLFRDSLQINRDSHAWFRNKVVTMIDDHDQVRKGNNKARFCANDQDTSSSMLAALALNLCTLGIPCVYYGSEQEFDGSGGSDRYIREAMFGGKFGPFRSQGYHLFDPTSTIYQQFAKVVQIRREQDALRRGRQYLREISGDVAGQYGLPHMIGNKQMKSVVPWSRVFVDTEILCAINTDMEKETAAWVTVDKDIHQIPGKEQMKCLYSTENVEIGNQILAVEGATEPNGRAVVKLTVPPGGFVIYM